MAVMQPSWNISLSINLYHCYVTGIHATRSTTIKELHSFLGRNAGIFRGRKNYKPLNFFPFSFALKKKKKKGSKKYSRISILVNILRIEVEKKLKKRREVSMILFEFIFEKKRRKWLFN